jgi:hypothetical protein
MCAALGGRQVRVDRQTGVATQVVVVRDERCLHGLAAGVELGEDTGHGLMPGGTYAVELRAVRGVSHQRVVEPQAVGVGGIDVDQVAAHEAGHVLGDRLGGKLTDGIASQRTYDAAQHGQLELAADRRRHLRHRLGRAHRIET